MVRRGLQTQGEWAAVRRQPIYFVPPKLAATMPQLVKGRRSAEQYDAEVEALLGGSGGLLAGRKIFPWNIAGVV